MATQETIKEEITSSVAVSRMLAYIFFGSFSFLAVFLTGLYCFKFNKMGADCSYGALLDGTKVKDEKRSRWILFFPILLLTRRIALALSVFLLDKVIWAQLAI